MKILKYPDNVLSNKSNNVVLDKDVYDFLSEMKNFIKEYKGWGQMVGLAAPQVGKNWNIFYALDQFFINPSIEVFPMEGTSKLKEGCYSLEDNKFDYPTTRYYKVMLSWTDFLGNSQRKVFKGHDAQIIQHEMDHLSGIMCNSH